MRRVPPAGPPIVLARVCALAAHALAILALASMVAGSSAWAAKLTSTDIVHADLVRDDQLRVRDRDALHRAAATITFDQYRGNDPDVLAACRGDVSCDVRGDATVAQRSGVAFTLGHAPPLLLALAWLPLACIAVALAWSARRRLVAHVRRADRPVRLAVVATWAVVGVVGVRNYDVLGGAYPALVVHDLVVACAIIAWALVLLRGASSVVRRTDALRSVAHDLVAPLAVPGVLLLIGFVAFAWLSRRWTPGLENADATLASILSGVTALIALVVLVRGDRGIAAWAVGGVAAAATVGSAIGAATLARVDARAAGIPADPNFLAVTAACGAGIALVGAARAGSRVLRTGSAIAVLAGITTIAASQSRTGVLALVASLLVGTWLLRSWRVAGATVGIVATTIALVIFVPVLGVAGSSQSALERSTAGSVSSGRIDTWRNGLRQVRANPVRGVGIGGFVPSIDRYRVPGDRSFVQAAHNTPLQVLAELGAVGMALFAAMICAFVVPLLRRARAGDALAVAWCAGFAALAVASMLLTTYADPIAWIVLGLGAITIAAGPQRRAAGNADEDADEPADVVMLRPQVLADDAGPGWSEAA